MKILDDEAIKEVVFLAKNKLIPIGRAIAQAQNQYTMRQVVEWGAEPCPHSRMANFDGENDVSLRNRSECPKCWQELKDKVKEWE